MSVLKAESCGERYGVRGFRQINFANESMRLRRFGAEQKFYGIEMTSLYEIQLFLLTALSLYGQSQQGV